MALQSITQMDLGLQGWLFTTKCPQASPKWIPTGRWPSGLSQASGEAADWGGHVVDFYTSAYSFHWKRSRIRYLEKEHPPYQGSWGCPNHPISHLSSLAQGKRLTQLEISKNRNPLLPPSPLAVFPSGFNLRRAASSWFLSGRIQRLNKGLVLVAEIPLRRNRVIGVIHPPTAP